MILAAIRLLRPKQWTKNLLVFAALIFTHSYSDTDLVSLTLLAFASMCLASSAVYTLNDVIDAERDRNHPRKKHRPVASGAIRPALASVIGLLCLGGGVALALQVNVSFLLGVAVYLMVQVLYSLGLKAVPILDVFIVATGFVLRAVLGALAIEVGISGWLLLCTGLLALMLGFAKRRHEFMSQGEGRGDSRPALLGYTQAALDALVVFSSAGAALAYGVYAIESDTAKKYPALVLTLPAVLYGVMRYLFLVFGRQEGGEPENLVFGDLHMIVCVIAFVCLALLAMSGYRIGFIQGP